MADFFHDERGTIHDLLGGLTPSPRYTRSPLLLAILGLQKNA